MPLFAIRRARFSCLICICWSSPTCIWKKGSSFARRGQLIPPYDTAATLDMLAQAIARYQPRTIISLGDSFHDAKASERLPSLYAIRLKSLMEHRDWLWITGNHRSRTPG